MTDADLIETALQREGWIPMEGSPERDITTGRLQRLVGRAVMQERSDCAQIIADAANKAADYNNLRDYELLRALENAIRARGSA
jgi:hypothetical protein